MVATYYNSLCDDEDCKNNNHYICNHFIYDHLGNVYKMPENLKPKYGHLITNNPRFMGDKHDKETNQTESDNEIKNTI